MYDEENFNDYASQTHTSRKLEVEDIKAIKSLLSHPTIVKLLEPPPESPTIDMA